MVTTKLFLIGLLCCGLALAVEQEGDNPLDWLRNSIPGEPGVDYPIQAAIQETSFTCDDKIFGGYYADPEADCQSYHVCLKNPIDPETLFPVSFLCPNGTVFNQEVFVCDWWFNVDCAAAVSLYAGVEGAFGSDAGAAGGAGGDVGECPAPPYGGSEAECAGAVSNCWSPGQRDTDCPNNGLCCFDGCADVCVDTPRPPPPPPVSPVEAESEVKPDAIAPPPPPPKTTPPPPPPTTKPPVTEGYEYPVPEVPLELPKPSPPPPGVPTLYGPPPI